MQKIYSVLSTPHTLLTVLIFSFILFFGSVAVLRHDNFHSRRLDLGNMDQTIWNVVNGNGFTLTDPMGTSQLSRLAVHADFLLILISPLYIVWSDPRVLLLLQVIIVGIGAIPVYWIAIHVLKSDRIAVFFAALYLLYPPLGRNMLHDFHAVSLTTTFLLFAYWYMVKGKYLPFIIIAVLSALGKEHIWITIALMGIYISVWKKSPRIGVPIVAFSGAMFYILFWIAIPAVSPVKQHFALSYLSEFGGGLNEIVKNLLINPLGILSVVLRPDRLLYYFQLLFPLGFLPVFSPFVLLFSMESLLINSLSNNPLMRQIDYQYTSTIIPFLMVSAIHGYAVLDRIVLRIKRLGFLRKVRIILIYLSVCLSISVYLWGEFPTGKTQWFWHFITPVPERQVMNAIAASIDSTKTVSVTNNIGAHFSQRKYLYNFPINADKADYTVVYLGDTYAWPSGDAQRYAVTEMLANGQYELVAQEGNFFAFKKK
jgi:uncharacterized membrane protein